MRLYELADKSEGVVTVVVRERSTETIEEGIDIAFVCLVNRHMYN